MQQSQPDSLLAKDETFPELQEAASSSTVVGDDEAASTGRTEGDAFPKAFDRELVTPTNLDSRQVSIESCSSSNGPKSSPSPLVDHEERRRSILDHHWAVPRSIEKEDSKDDSTKEEVKEVEEDEEIKDKEEPQKPSSVGEVRKKAEFLFLELNLLSL